MNGWFVGWTIIVVVVAILQMDVVDVVIGNWTMTRGTSCMNNNSIVILLI